MLRRLTSRRLALSASLLLAACCLALPAGATAAGNGSISGRVTDASTHAGLSGTQVIALDGAGNWVASTQTAADGSYDLGLAPGSYALAFSPPDGSHLGEYYDDKPTLTAADPVTVSAGQATAHVDAALAAAGQISGTVTDGATGLPVPDVDVDVYDSARDWVADVYTDGRGRYTVGDLPTGSYRVGFVPHDGQPYARQWASGRGTLGSADPIAVTAGTTRAGVDAHLVAQGVITGTVTDAATHQPARYVQVDVYDAAGNYVGDAEADRDGGYAVGGLADGSYRVAFSYGDGNWAPQYFSGRATLQAADPVAVSAGHPAVADAALTAGGRIQGTVTDAATHQPVTQAWVDAFDAADDDVTEAEVDDQGRYTLQGLAPGSYRIEVSPFDQVHATTFHHARATLAAADPVAVAAGQTTTGIDEALSSGGAIAGSVTDAASGRPVAGANVRVYDATGDEAAEGSAAADGTYRVGGLAAGSYRVQVSGPSSDIAGGYTGRWYGGLALGSATAVTVTLAHTTGGVDVGLTGGGRIAGTVTRATTHAPVAGATVSVSYAGYTWAYWTATTAADGTYVVGGVPSGDYDVRFSAPSSNLTDQAYDDRAPTAIPDTVAVDAGTTTPGIDAALADGGAIAGAVTDAATHAAVRGAAVTAYAADGSTVQTATTAADGAYTLSGMPPGPYRVGFAAPAGSDLRPQYDGGATSLDDARPVTAPAGSATHGVNAALAAGAALTGTVTAATGGGPVSEGDVLLYDASGSLVDWVSTDFHGAYAFHGVAAGSYRVGFSAAGYLQRYYGGAATFDAATPVAASAGQTVAHVDAALPDSGGIRGTVTDAALHVPVGGVTVTAYDAGTNAIVSTATTDAAGRYRVRGLPGGGYRVGYTVPTSYPFPYAPYVPQYYPAAATLAAGGTVSVTTGQTTPGVDTALQLGGDVEGTVTNATTHAPAAGVDVTVYDAAGASAGSATTGSDGGYAVAGLAPGHYRVGFATAISGSRYVGKYYDDASSLSSARQVTVTADARTTGVDASLVPSGSITGTITDAHTGQPVPDVGVRAQGSAGSSYGYSDASGRYELYGLPTGSYTVATDASPSQDHVNASYAHNPVSVTTGQATAGIDVALQPAAHIGGTLTDAATHAPAASVVVRALSSSDGSFNGAAISRADGTYDIGGLAAGTYKVEFAALGGTANYRSGYYDRKGGYDSADTVTVTAGQHLSSIDGALQRGGEIDGTVTDADTAQPVQGASVSVYDSSSTYVDGASTRSDGTYAVHGLAPGQYRVLFSRYPYGSQFYDGKPTIDQATVVTVAAGAATTDINAAMRTGGGISGTVTDATTGDPLGGTTVQAETVNGDWLASVVTDSQGRYSLSGLPDGTAIVHFLGDGVHAGEYYDDESTAADATRLTVTTDQTTTGVDAALDAGAAIRGTVTTVDTGQGLAHVAVYASPTGGGTTRYAITDSDGRYTVEGLSTGAYQLSFLPLQNQNYVAAAYPSNVSVTSGQATVGIDQALQVGGRVSGTVTDASTGDPLVGVSVWGTGGTSPGGGFTTSVSTATDDQGHYTVAGLPTGAATITAYDGTGYHAQKSTASGAVTATAGSTLSGVDLALTPTGVLSGTVTTRDTSAPISGAGVTLYDSAGSTVTSTSTGFDGRYRFAGLAAGSYRVAFDAGFTQAGYGTVYYDGKATLAAADPVAVTTGHTTGGVDGTLFGPPVNQSPPTIAGTAKQGQLLTAHQGTWTQLPDSYAYQWLRCPTAGGCVAISDATDSTYTLTDDDALSTIEVQEVAHNAAGAGSPATSSPTASVVPLPPVSTRAPAISGTVQQGKTLTAFDGAWSNHPTSFTRQWKRCDTAGASCAAISGATGTTYVPVAADVGSTLVVSVTATNSGGASPAAASAATPVVVPPIPTTVTAPTVTGSAVQGQTLTEHHGGWTNAPTAYGYQWQRCDALGGSCLSIGGATGSTYTPVAADVGATLVVLETAANAGGPSIPATSAATAVVAAAPPVNTSAPSVTGTAQQGQTLTEHHGSWTNQPTSYGYQWQRCDTAGANCAAISGATAGTYALVAADVGKTVRVAETASNAGGASQPAPSSPSAVVVPPIPTIVTPPSIAGTARQGDTLTASTGAWTNAPTSYGYLWERCTALGTSCVAIPVATGSTYVPDDDDVGATLRVTVVAQNDGGTSAPSSSAVTAVVVPAAPVNVTPTAISGIARQGETLTADDGDWTNQPTSVAHQWLRCDAAGGACNAIPGATDASYVAVAADVGGTLRDRATASNASGVSAPATSQPTGVVAPPAPELASAPTITGAPQQGRTLTLHHGSWTHSPTSYDDRWERCDPLGASCLAIDGAAGGTYTPAAADQGATLRVTETATNDGGTSDPSSSDTTTVVLPAPPTNLAPPTITGVAQQGQTLTAHDGSWTDDPTSDAFAWQRCDAAGLHCAAIPGATSATYTPVATDVGITLRVAETATNDGGASAPTSSAATAKVLPPVPTVVSAPTVGGIAQQGQTLTEQHGSWTNEPTAFTYQWRRCDAAGADCADVGGATGQSYTAATADVGHTLRVAEAASNGGVPSAPATSDPTATITVPPLKAMVGEATTVDVGTPATLNGSGSSPGGVIDSYTWDFGDRTSGTGAIVQHAYATPGTYTAKLTIADAGHTDQATTTVTVVPPADGARVTVRDSSGNLLPGASLIYVGADGHRTTAVSGPDGVGNLPGLPDGGDAVDVWKGGYQPVVVTVDVRGGIGSATATLTPGELARTTLTSHPMTLAEIVAAGIDVTDPANQNVYTFSIHLNFTAPIGGASHTDFCGYINGDGQFVGDTGFDCGPGGSGGGGGGDGGGRACSSSCTHGPLVATGEVVDGHPLISWLVLQGQVTTLKQFFSVNLVVDNLSDEPFELSDGSATLDIPSGLSLAPTATSQDLAQSVPTIPGKGSATASWVVRGDTPGFYGLTASYHGRLQPFDAPVDLSATLADPLHVWGADALGLKVQADSGALKAGRPYHVRVGVTNHADVSFYNVSIGVDPSTHERFVFQPDERFSDSVGEIPAGKTVYGHAYVLVPDADSVGGFDPQLSTASFDGQPVRPGDGIEAVAPPRLYDLQAPTNTVGDVHLHWEPVPGADGYGVFSIPDLDTPFEDAPDSVQDFGGDQVTTLPASADDAFIPVSADSARYYAVSTIVDGRPTLEHTVVVGRPGVAPPDDAGGGGAGGGGAGGSGAGGTSGGSEQGLGVPKPTCALSKVVVGGVTIQAACFAKDAKGVLQARGHIRVGGLDVSTSGGFTIDPGALSLRSGGAADVYAGTLHLYHGDVKWQVQAHKSLHLDAPAGLRIKGLPVAGSIDADFTATGVEATANAAIGNSESPFGITGKVHLQATPTDGLKLDKFKLTLDSDMKIQSLVVKQASLAWERTSGGDRWTGTVKVDLPSGPEISGKLVLLGGAVAEVGINVDKINKPLGEVVFLQSLGLDVALKPHFKATGSIGLSAGPKILGAAAAELDASLSAQFQPHFVLGANGTLKLVELTVSSASLTAQIPGGVSFSGDMVRGFPGFSLDAHIGGTVDSRHFEAEGGASVKIPGASGHGKALVDDQGVAGCADAQTDLLHQSFTVGGGHNWRSGHNGLLDGACGFDDLERTIAHLSSASAHAALAVDVPAASAGKQVNLIAQGSGGAPTVVLTHGSETVTVVPGTSGRFADTEYVALSDPEGSRTGIILPRAPAGSVSVAPAAGGAPVMVTETGLLPSPNVRVKVRPLGRRSYRLTWTARRIGGQQLVLRETAGGASTTLRTTTAASGRLTFTPLATPTAAHRIQVVVDQDGAPREILSSAATFRVAPPKLARPHVRIARHGAAAAIRWSAVRDADHYEITVTTSDDRRLFFSRPRSMRSLVIPAASKIGAKVRAIGATQTAGPAGSASSRGKVRSRRPSRRSVP